MTSIPPPFFKKTVFKKKEKRPSSLLEPGGWFLPVVNNINYQGNVRNNGQNHENKLELF
jgi:hypothetical protein